MVRQRGYVELLTIFPDKRDETTKQFLAFLPTSGFEKLWGV
jgi:CRISPR-associated protein Cmr6